MSKFEEKVPDIKIIFMDVDGVLTDGSVVFIDGESPKKWHVRDRLGIKILKGLSGLDIKVVWISGRPCAELAQRARELDVDEVFSNVSDKFSVMKSALEKYGFTEEEALYIGDDLVDIKCMRSCGLSACPADADEEIKSISDLVAAKNGGRGAVREVIEKLLKSRGIWEAVIENFKSGHPE